MEEEKESMKTNRVWELVDPPKGCKPIDHKWILKIKHKADRTIERYKTHLITKGYTHQEEIDYEETFSPVVIFTSIRLILAIVASLDLELHQMDVKTACDAPKPGGPLTTRQPAEYKWMSGYPTPLQKIGQSLLCTGSSTQLQNLHILSQTIQYMQYTSQHE